MEPLPLGRCIEGTQPEVTMPRRSIAAAVLVPFLLLIAALAAPATQAGGGCHMPDGSVYTEGESTVIRMDTCSFSPTIARVPVGTAVRFLNTSTIDHAVVGRAGTFESQILSPGAEYAATFATAGTFPFSCPLHPGMVGAIVVGGDAPGAAAPAAAVMTSTSTGAAASQTAAVDLLPLALAGIAGLGIGAIGGVLAAGAIATRRRGATD
jgi:plastocyanin